jgi:hypothetical protein
MEIHPLTSDSFPGEAKKTRKKHGEDMAEVVARRHTALFGISGKTAARISSPERPSKAG